MHTLPNLNAIPRKKYMIKLSLYLIEENEKENKNYLKEMELQN